MDKLNAMQRFLRVAELASFTRAADSLGLPRSSVSGAVQFLESRLGTRLLHRNTRSVSLTQDGRLFMEKCRALLSDLEELEGQFQRTPEDVTGTLRVDMPSRFASNFVIPRLPQLLDKYPNLQLEISNADHQVDVIAEGFDCVIRVGTIKDSSLIARPLTTFNVLNCVSPEYIKKFGEPGSLDELSNHHLIHYVPKLGIRPSGFEYVTNGRTHLIAMPGVITVKGTESYLAACLAGLGIAQIPAVGVKDYIEQGKLISVLPDYPAEPMPVFIVYPSRLNPSRRVRVFMEWLEEVVGEY